MKKGIALLLALLMIMSSLFVVSSAEDGAVDAAEADEGIISEIITSADEAVPEEVFAADAETEDEEEEEPEEPSEPAQAEEPADPAEAAQPEAPAEPSEPEQPEESEQPEEAEAGQPEEAEEEPEETEQPEEPEEAEEDPETPAGEVTGEDQAETVLFEEGYVALKKGTAVYENALQEEPIGSFTEDSVAYAVLMVENEEEPSGNWLLLTFDTEEARAEGTDLLKGYVQQGQVSVLSAEETEALEAQLAEDPFARETAGHKLPAAAYQASEQPEADPETEDTEELESNAAELQVFQAAISPKSAKAKEGATVSFKATPKYAAGTVNYQWQYGPDGTNFTNIDSSVAGASGFDTDTLKIKTDANTFKNCYYRCMVSDNHDGSVEVVWTNAAKLTALPSVSVSAPITRIGKTIKLSASVKNKSGKVTYQWQYSTDKGKKWQNATFKGNKTSQMTVKVNTTNVKYQYRCKIKTGGKTDTSKATTIFATQAKKSASTVEIGKKAKFSVKVWNSGSGRKYQWQYNRNGTWQDCPSSYSGSQTDTMTVKVTEDNCHDKYRCVVSGKNGRTNAATLAIKPKPRYFALIIANNDYLYANDLPGVYKDGTAMSTALKKYGWKVKLTRNLTAAQMESTIASYFTGKLPSDVCLLYYSGHGNSSSDTGSYSYAGSLVGVDSDYLLPGTLRDVLWNNTQGQVIVILDSCGSGSTILKANKEEDEQETAEDPKAFTNGIMNAFSGYLSEDEDAEALESNTGELRQKRFAVLAACAHGKTSSDGYFVKKSGKLCFERGGTFTYSLIRTMGCNYPSGKLSGSRKKITLKQARDGVRSEVKNMNKLLKNNRYIAWYAGDAYNTPGYYYFSPVEQSVQMGGSSSTILFRK